MVYFGPSKGCETCKRRRKKCDETRPSCLRCQNSKRTCGGYEHSSHGFRIRQYNSSQHQHLGKQHTAVPTQMQQPLARKCSLPVREPLPGTHTLPPDTIPKEVNIDQVDQFALGAFFYDYCISSSNSSISPGFLTTLQHSFHTAKSHSMLKKACKAVAYASHGIKLNRPSLSHWGTELYHQLLAWFAAAIHGPVSAKSQEYLVVTMLLGLYEIIVGDGKHPDCDNAHAGGVAAMLGIRKSPLYLLEAIGQGHPLLSGKGIEARKTLFPTSGSKKSARSLDDLMLSLGVLHKRGAAALKESHGVSLDTIIQLRNQALALDSAFVAWEAAHERDFYPNTIFHIRESSESMRTHYPVGLWPGKVDTYFDHYIAGIWNLYRASRVSLQDIILKFSDVLNDGRSLEAENMVADFLVEDMLSSIPFHLTENLHDFSREITKGVNNIHNPGRSIGGLLLMHSIMATSHLEIVDVKIRIYLRDCLRWIGEHMGIGQASILAESPIIEPEYFGGSSMIILVGLIL